MLAARSRVGTSACITLLLFTLLTACDRPDDSKAEGALGVHEAPIVGGTLESGWLGVGALTRVYGDFGYMGPFCTATLVRDSWVLTAAHCLSDKSGVRMLPDNVRFYVGADATPASWGSFPAAGELLEVDAVFVHPEYNPIYAFNDIALAHLTAPAEGVPTYGINAAPLSDDFVGQPVLYVGFGATEGVNQTGGGRKRSAELTFDSFYSAYYASSSTDTGVCFGDSGGPGLFQADGGWTVIGVNSAVSSASGDPCRSGFATHTRVDVFIDWIEEHVDGPAPSCLSEPGMCLCDDACRPDGTCDNAACRTLGCRAVGTCLDACPSDARVCRENCSELGTEEAKAQLQEVQRCIWTSCPNLHGAALEQCIADSCGEEVDDCYQLATGDGDCRAIESCSARCPDGDEECRTRCLERGTAEAQTEFGAVLECGFAACGEAPDADRATWTACLYAECTEAVDSCRQPSGCAPTGGDCPPGTACVVTGTGATDCLPSVDAGLGAPCDPASELLLPCGDGLACVEDELGALCVAVCAASGDCPNGVECVPAGSTGADEWGVCLCRDDDGDGACRGRDCDDQDAGVSPDAAERCDDGIDNDCDGATDEDCGSEPTAPDAVQPGGDTVTGGDDGSGASGGGCAVGDRGAASTLLPLFLLLGLALRRRWSPRARG